MEVTLWYQVTESEQSKSPARLRYFSAIATPDIERQLTLNMMMRMRIKFLFNEFNECGGVPERDALTLTAPDELAVALLG